MATPIAAAQPVYPEAVTVDSLVYPLDENREAVDFFLGRTKELAESTIPQPKPAPAEAANPGLLSRLTSVSSTRSTRRSVLDFSRGHTVNVSFGGGGATAPARSGKSSKEDKAKDKSNGIFVILGIAAAVVGLAAAYFVGKESGERDGYTRDLSDIKASFGYFNSLVGTKEQQVEIQSILDVKFFAEKILTNLRNHKARNVIALVTIVAGSALALYGSFLCVSAVVTTGAMIGIVGAGGLLWERGRFATVKADNVHMAKSMILAIKKLDAMEARKDTPIRVPVYDTEYPQPSAPVWTEKTCENPEEFYHYAPTAPAA
jgi:hypothetical protein